MLADRRQAWSVIDPLTDLATVPATPIHPAVVAGRAPLAPVVTDLIHVPDGTLDGSWRWRPTEADDLELRCGSYAIHEGLERAIGEIAVGRDGGSGGAGGVGPAVPALGAMTEARWDLRGVLAGLAAETWGRRPGPRRMDGPPDDGPHLRRAAVVQLVQRLVPREFAPGRHRGTSAGKRLPARTDRR